MPDPKLTALKDQAAKRNPTVPQVSGSASLISPPMGYKLTSTSGYAPSDFKGLPDNSDVPAFIQQGVDMSKVKQIPTPVDPASPNDIAYVGSTTPYDVHVVQPDIYGPPVFNHELMHTFQDTRNPALGDTSAPISENATHEQTYGYGGIEGLQKAIQGRKTIANFNREQQAEIVKDYKAIQDKYLAKARSGKLTDADKKALYTAHQAYHPMVQQLASMPGKEVNLSPSLLDMALGRNMPTIDITPEAPGLPDYSVKGIGVLPADPLLGGNSVATPTPGTKKRYVNGKIGVWDGHGWRAQK